MEEICKEYMPNYEISNFGNARRINKPRALKAHEYSNGYLFFSMMNRGHLVHRCVAKAFIPNPNNYRCVNHKNGNKKDNTVDNLEWCDHSFNHLHAYRQLGRTPYWKGKTKSQHPKSKIVEQIDSIGNAIKEFESAREASKEACTAIGAIGKSIRENYKVKGFKYRYKKVG